jgi:hypothetical protein
MPANDKTGRPANDNGPCSTPVLAPCQRIGGIKPPAILATAAPANDNGVNTAVDRDSGSGKQISPPSVEDRSAVLLGPLGDSLDDFAGGSEAVAADEAEVTKFRDPHAHSGSVD